MNGGLITACVGLAILAGAGGAYIALHELKPAPQAPQVIHVQTPTFGPVPHVTVTSVPAPTPRPSPAPEWQCVGPKDTRSPNCSEEHVAAPVVKPKPTKRKASAVKKLKTKWAEPPQPNPFSFEDLFNVRR
jgi:outer membrane biosynthesis protein TonB